MKKIILSLLFAGCMQANAQKDISLSLISPVNDQTISANVAFSITFSVKNESSQTIMAGDSLLIQFFINNSILTFSGGINTLIFAHPDKAPGDTIMRGLGLTLSTAPPKGATFCVLALLRNGGSLDTALSNNAGCATGINNNTGVFEQVLSKSLKVYPNPAHDMIHVEMEYSSASTFNLFDITGRNIKTSVIDNGDGVVDVSGINRGIYFYEILSTEGNVIKSGKITITQ